MSIVKEYKGTFPTATNGRKPSAETLELIDIMHVAKKDGKARSIDVTSANRKLWVNRLRSLAHREGLGLSLRNTVTCLVFKVTPQPKPKKKGATKK